MTKSKIQNVEELLEQQNRLMSGKVKSVANPLMPWFREPGPHMTFPTRAMFYDDEIVTLTMSNEIEIYPMGGYDEMILKNADGLLNGDSIEKVILSCVPGVHFPRKLMVPDVDAIMLAIRFATYGNDLDFETVCPACKFENTYSADIQKLLDTIIYLDKEMVVDYSKDVKIYIRPYNYESHIKANVVTFEQTKLMKSLDYQNDLSEEEKKKIIDESFNKIANLNFDLITSAIYKIEIPGEIVTDFEHIKEFLRNIPVKKANIIQEKINEVNKIGINREVDAVCRSCGHEWVTKVVYDPSHFFG